MNEEKTKMIEMINDEIRREIALAKQARELGCETAGYFGGVAVLRRMIDKIKNERH